MKDGAPTRYSDGPPRKSWAATHLPDSAFVVLSPWVFRIVWSLFLFFHFFNMIFAAGFGVVYILWSARERYKAIQATQIPMSIFGPSGWGYSTIAILHAIAGGKMIVRSILERKLTFRSESPVRQHESKVKESHEKRRMPTMNKAIAPLRKSNRISPTRTESTQQIPVPSIVRYINLLYDKFVNLDDFLGANGRHFDSVFAVLEVLEMASQTYQAYHLSCSVKAAWINHFAVSVVVLRALTTSLSHGLTRGKRGRRRLFVLVFDMWLDFACVVIVPMFISYPYVVASFNWKQNGFDPRLIYNETWVASAIAEGRYVLVTSWIDLITSLIPHVGILSCLSMLKSLIFRCDESDVIQPSIAKQYPPPPVPVSAMKRMRYIHKLLNIFVVGWGVAVLGIHVIAQRAMNNSIPPCKLILGAWFVTNVSCAVIQFNCYRLGYDGNAEFATTVLAQLERSIVVKITFAHCPALEIPDILNEFSRFYDMDIYNSTLVDWPASASINRDRHPKFDHLYFFATNMSAFPAGILHGALPSPFNKLAFYRTNLSVIPPSLGDHWSEQEWLVMYFEFNQITSIPD